MELFDRIDQAVNSGEVAYTAVAIWGDEQEATMHTFTNDNFDTGYPSSYAEWRNDFTRGADGQGALEKALKVSGNSRVTMGGVVSVYVNGEPV